MHIALLGATGGTGRHILAEARRQGHLVTALVRAPDKAYGLDGAEIVQGDARSVEQLAELFRGKDAVVSTLGTGVSPFKSVHVLSQATQAIVDAMRQTNVGRLVCITGMGAGDSRGHGGFFFERLFKPLLLHHVYEDKDRQEAVIRSSGLDWIIVRPSVLNNNQQSREVRALTDLNGFNGGTISRADVARFVVEQLDSDQWLRQAPLISW